MGAGGMSSTRVGWATIALVVMAALMAESEACPFTAIFNFGDSNSDTGGLVAAFPSLARPNGETTFNEPAGRFSDGRLIIDFIGTFPTIGFRFSPKSFQANDQYQQIAHEVHTVERTNSLFAIASSCLRG
jgi:hypothetical protein